MKPSERIEEIYNEKYPYEEELGYAFCKSIIDYLDEEYEKKQKEELENLVQKDIKSKFRSTKFL